MMSLESFKRLIMQEAAECRTAKGFRLTDWEHHRSEQIGQFAHKVAHNTFI